MKFRNQNLEPRRPKKNIRNSRRIFFSKNMLIPLWWLELTPYPSYHRPIHHHPTCVHLALQVLQRQGSSIQRQAAKCGDLYNWDCLSCLFVCTALNGCEWLEIEMAAKSQLGRRAHAGPTKPAQKWPDWKMSLPTRLSAPFSNSHGYVGFRSGHH